MIRIVASCYHHCSVLCLFNPDNTEIVVFVTEAMEAMEAMEAFIKNGTIRLRVCESEGKRLTQEDARSRRVN